MLLSKFNLKERKAQGILEVVIAISVVVIGLVSIMSLVIFNVNLQSYNQDMLIASNLAREGIEVVRNIRDSNWLDSTKDWDDSLFDGSDSEGKENSFIISNRSSWDANDFSYDLLPIGMFWKDCILNDALCRLYLTPILGNPGYEIYNYGYDLPGELIVDAEATNFYRMIYINEICQGNGVEYILENYGERCFDDYADEKIGMQVISKVAWMNRDQLRTLEVEERLYNWK